MSIHVKEVAYIFHPVSDIARGRGFYEKLDGHAVTFHERKKD
jgi:hypothetical protein